MHVTYLLYTDSCVFRVEDAQLNKYFTSSQRKQLIDVKMTKCCFFKRRSPIFNAKLSDEKLSSTRLPSQLFFILSVDVMEKYVRTDFVYLLTGVFCHVSGGEKDNIVAPRRVRKRRVDHINFKI